jgi:hypothetical protein
MKKLSTLLFWTFLLLTTSQAQIKKGSLLLGGDLSFYSSKTNGGSNSNTENDFLIAPSIGKAVKDNTFLGGQLNIRFGKNYLDYNPTEDYRRHSYGAGVFYRKYKMLANKFYLFLQGSLGANFSKVEFKSSVDYYYDQKNLVVSANLYPGLSYRITEKLFLEAGFRDIASIAYSNDRQNGYNFGNIINTHTNSFYFSSSLNNFNSSLSFGFRLLLNKEVKK